MSLDIGVELCREEIPLDHVAFEFGHVDAIGGKSAERLVKGRRDVLHAEDKCGDDLALAARRPFLLARKNDEPRRIVRLVFDVFGQDVETVDFRREPRGDSGTAFVAGFA